MHCKKKEEEEGEENNSLEIESINFEKNKIYTPPPPAAPFSEKNNIETRNKKQQHIVLKPSRPTASSSPTDKLTEMDENINRKTKIVEKLTKKLLEQYKLTKKPLARPVVEDENYFSDDFDLESSRQRRHILVAENEIFSSNKCAQKSDVSFINSETTTLTQNSLIQSNTEQLQQLDQPAQLVCHFNAKEIDNYYINTSNDRNENLHKLNNKYRIKCSSSSNISNFDSRVFDYDNNEVVVLKNDGTL